jgi:bacteriorhodopsin
MLLGMLYFIAKGWGEDDPKKQEYYVITIFIPAIAFASYLSMAMGFGAITVPVGGEMKTIYWARYADWLFTTPLLLLDLALLAGASRNAIATLVGADAAMIVTGLVGAISREPIVFGGNEVLTAEAARLIWWGVSCGFFLVVLYFLLSTLSRNAAQAPGEVGELFGTLRNLTAVLWTAYPIVWIVGTEGLGIVGLGPETAAFMVLDLLAKVGFGIILLSSRSALDAASGAATAQAAD